MLDGSRFDNLTRSLATPVRTRRAMLRALAGAALASAGLVRSTGAAAVCRADNLICRKDGDCCSGQCKDADQYGRRRCGCRTGYHLCDGICVSNTDLNTCGSSCSPCPSDACNTATCDGATCGLDPLTGPQMCGTNNEDQCCAGQCCSFYSRCIDGQCLSCFTAGTRVAMADGLSKPIEFVSFGDLVLGQDGNVNSVIGIETPSLGSRKLYALNDGDPFVTAEHPFMTTGGWKSIDPSATADENPSLRVGSLQTGDSLIQLVDALVPALVTGRDPVEVRTRPLPLRALRPVSADPETRLYNLLLDGDHTYFANELLVHNKV